VGRDATRCDRPLWPRLAHAKIFIIQAKILVIRAKHFGKTGKFAVTLKIFRYCTIGTLAGGLLRPTLILPKVKKVKVHFGGLNLKVIIFSGLKIISCVTAIGSSENKSEKIEKMCVTAA